MNAPTVGFVSLGCAKATVDSERILTQLKAEGYGFSANYEHADLVVVNTCGFIESAVDESLDVISQALGANGRVIVRLRRCTSLFIICYRPVGLS
jgi:ribosomal protein S12 methylthiotransferase